MVEAGQGQIGVIQDAVGCLPKARVQITGVVLNKLDPKKRGAYVNIQSALLGKLFVCKRFWLSG
ncbi:hypothetical protein EOPP23_15220 [Endozoicomonas sp. OPT23]|nr:hypothetical protein [Endozoicomonas sp. OPT23]